MNDLDPAWLRSFAAIARAGSITRAGQQVHRTQSAVSTHLQQLEAAVGARLVERSTRALALTASGLAFLPHAQALLRAQDAAHAAVRPAREAVTHRLGISEYFTPDRFGELLGVLRDAAGAARFELQLGCTGSQAAVAAIRAGWGVGCLNASAITPDMAILTRQDAKRWPSPGRLSFYLLARPDARPLAQALAACAR